MPEPLVRGGGPGVSLAGLLSWQSVVAKSGLKLRQKIHAHPLLSRRILSPQSSWSVTEQNKATKSVLVLFFLSYPLRLYIYNSKNGYKDGGWNLLYNYSLKNKRKDSRTAKCCTKSSVKQSSTSCLGAYPLSSRFWTQLLHLSFSQIFFRLYTCCYICACVVRPVSERIHVVFDWWKGQNPYESKS